MTRDKRNYHAGIRMTEELWENVLKYSQLQQIPAAEYCRRAIEKQINIDRDGKDTHKEELKAEIRQILEELGIDTGRKERKL